MNDLPWSQQELPVYEPPEGFTWIDLNDPARQRVACGFKTLKAAQFHAAGLQGRYTVEGALRGEPHQVLLGGTHEEHRVGRGWCVWAYPRWPRGYDTVPF